MAPRLHCGKVIGRTLLVCCLNAVSPEWDWTEFEGRAPSTSPLSSEVCCNAALSACAEEGVWCQGSGSATAQATAFLNNLSKQRGLIF